MRRLGIGFFFVLFSFAAAAVTGLHFPALTGRVVDDAHILSSRTVETLDSKLAAYERGTTHQVVVVTLPSLQGQTIEDYGYQLGRYWAIGQKDKNNGVLLIVAPHERKVRIEVGYGLEGTLTDAASSAIINGIIVPNFKIGDMERGVIDGTDAILSVLGGKSIQSNDNTAQPSGSNTILGLIFLVIFLWMAIRHPFIMMMLMANSRTGGSSFGDSGGGFSGGGGSFGGGGASGSW